MTALRLLSANGGYASGGNLAKAAGANNTSGKYFVTYLGTNDADANALPAGARELSFNGVALGAGFSGVDYNNVLL